MHRDKGYQYYPKVIVVYVLRNMPFFTRIFILVSHAGVVENRISSLPVYPASYLNVNLVPSAFPSKNGPHPFFKGKALGRRLIYMY